MCSANAVVNYKDFLIIFWKAVKKEYLDRCQVATPPEIVELIWSIVLQHRQPDQLCKVLDLGAGDTRFSHADCYGMYKGIEVDSSKIQGLKLNGYEQVAG